MDTNIVTALIESGLWDVRLSLWIFGGICALIVSLCFFARQ